MATIRKFEDIIAWQRARSINKLIYAATDNGKFARDFGLRDQIRRSAVSIMANIAEGFARRSDKDFAYFLNIARSSAAEVQSHLYVALDQGYLPQAEFDAIYAELEEVSRMIYGFARHLISK